MSQSTNAIVAIGEVSLMESSITVVLEKSSHSSFGVCLQISTLNYDDNNILSGLKQGDICNISFETDPTNKTKRKHRLTMVQKAYEVVFNEESIDSKMRSFTVRFGRNHPEQTVFIPPIGSGMIIFNSNKEMIVLKNGSFGYIHILYCIRNIYIAWKHKIPYSQYYNVTKKHVEKCLKQLQQEERCDILQAVNDKNEEKIKKLMLVNYHCLDNISNEKKRQKEEKVIVQRTKDIMEKFEKMLGNGLDVATTEKDPEGCDYQNYTAPKGKIDLLAKHKKLLVGKKQPGTCKGLEYDENEQENAIIAYNKIMELLEWANGKAEKDFHTWCVLNALCECYEETLNLPEEVLALEPQNGFEEYVNSMQGRFIDAPYLSIDTRIQKSISNANVIYARYFYISKPQDDFKIILGGREFVGGDYYSVEKLPLCLRTVVQEKCFESSKSNQ